MPRRPIKDDRLNSVVGIRIKPEALQRLRDHAGEQGQSISVTLGQIVEEAMASLDSEYDSAGSLAVSP